MFGGGEKLKSLFSFSQAVPTKVWKSRTFCSFLSSRKDLRLISRRFRTFRPKSTNLVRGEREIFSDSSHRRSGEISRAFFLPCTSFSHHLLDLLCLFLFFSLQVQLQTEVNFLSDTLRGDEATIIRVRLIRRLDEGVPVGDE